MVLRLFLAEMYYLSIELQTENINWTDVQFKLSRTKCSIEDISPEKFLKEAENLSEKIDVPLMLSLSTHNTRGHRGDTEQAENLHQIIQD